jgi:hypothetical protein
MCEQRGNCQWSGFAISGPPPDEPVSQPESRAVRGSVCCGYRYTAALAVPYSRRARHEQAVRLSMGLRARWRVRNLGFRSPIPQIVCVESDAEKIGRNESELLRSHSDNTYDDAVCSCNDPALPLLLPDEDRREDGQKAGQIIKTQHFPPLAPSISLFKISSSAV